MGKKSQSGRHKHIAQRTCVVCREVSEKRGLTRLVKTPDEGVVVDLTGKRNGRGAYLCDNPACWEQALHSDILNKALRVQLTNEDQERIKATMPRD